MSEILLSSAIVPQSVPGFSPTMNLRFEYFSDLIEVPEAHLFPWSEREIVELADPRGYRTLSRAGLLMMRALKNNEQALRNAISIRPERIGIYSAADPGPPHFPSLFEAANAPEENEKEILLLRTPPKQSFRIAQNFIGAQVAIDYNLRGPLNTFAHSLFGSIHALCQAEADLNLGRIDRALVCSAFSLEDPMQCARLRAQEELSTLSEAAGFLVLGKSAGFTDWEERHRTFRNRGSGISYGISSPLIAIIKEGGEL